MQKYKKTLFLFSSFALCSVVFSLVYNFTIAPAVIESIHGYRPDFAYQRFPLQFDSLGDGLIFILKNYGAFFIPVDNYNTVLIGSAVILFLFYGAVAIDRESKKSYLCSVISAGIFVLSIVCAGMMISRHPVMMQLPSGAYFQVFGAAFVGIFAIIFFESRSIKIRQLMTIFIVLAILSSFVQCLFQTENNIDDGLAFHKETTSYTIALLNDPEATPERPMPVTSSKLVEFVRKFQHQQ